MWVISVGCWEDIEDDNEDNDKEASELLGATESPQQESGVDASVDESDDFLDVNSDNISSASRGFLVFCIQIAPTSPSTCFYLIIKFHFCQICIEKPLKITHIGTFSYAINQFRVFYLITVQHILRVLEDQYGLTAEDTMIQTLMLHHIRIELYATLVSINRDLHNQ